MRWTGPSLALFASCSWPPALASAQEAVDQPLIVTGTRTAGAAAVETIPSIRLQSDLPVTALDALDRLPGVRAFSKGGAAGGSFVSLRGSEPNHSLILLDGVKVNDPTNSQGGAFDFSELDPLLLERIDVVKGSLSPVYGSDALAGVINLRLGDPGKATPWVARIRAGTIGTIGANIGGGLAWTDGGAILGASWLDSGEDAAGSDLKRWQVLTKVRQNAGGLVAEVLALRASANQTAFPEDSGGPRLAAGDARRQSEKDLGLGALRVSAPPSSSLRPSLSLDWVRQKTKESIPPIAPGVLPGVPGIVSDTRYNRLHAAADVLGAVGPVTLALGADFAREEARGAGSLDLGFPLPANFTIHRQNAGAYAEITYGGRGPGLLTASLRYDNPSGGAGVLTGRLAGKLQVKDGPLLRASFGKGFKLPSLYALAYPLIANPALKPERSLGGDLSAEVAIDPAVRLTLTLFAAKYRDLIDFDPDLFMGVNRARIATRGAEITLSAQLLETVRMEANLTHLHIERPSGTPPLRSRPPWDGSALIEWAPRQGRSLFLSVDATGASFDSSIPTGLVQLKGFMRVDAGAVLTLSDRLSFTLRMRNLLDSSYEEAIGFPAEGRTGDASMTFRF